MNQGSLLLTSTGLSTDKVARKFLEITGNLKHKKVAIITTAAEGKENNKYVQLAKKQFTDMGFQSIDFIDLETEPSKDFSLYGIIYVCGGNTFKLLKFARQANFKLSVEKLLQQGGVYVGVSAGSIIVGSSVQIASEILADKNEVGLEDLSGFGIVDLVILPHYSPELERDTKTFEVKYGVGVERINDTQAILIQNRKKTTIK